MKDKGTKEKDVVVKRQWWNTKVQAAIWEKKVFWEMTREEKLTAAWNI